MRRFSLLILLCYLMTAAVSLAEFTFSDVTPAPSPEGGEAAVSATQAGDAEVILITAAGDVTFGGNARKSSKSNMYTKQLDANEGNLGMFFANVLDIFSQDDLTLVNFEGTLTTATKYKESHEFIFRAPPEHVEALTLGSIEAVALENNHVMDFFEEGYNDTVNALTGAGIVYASEAHMGVYEVRGVSIALLAYQTFDGAYPRLTEKVPLDVAQAKAEHDIVIVSYHWGDEEKYLPNDKQIKLGRETIDAGADLVLGHHSHRVNPIELYNGKYIVYSLANCSFSGNTSPKDMDTFLFQQKFIVADGVTTPGPFRVIPASISSISGLEGKQRADNDLVVTPFEPGSEAAKRVIDKLLDNGRYLNYAVTSYPTDW